MSKENPGELEERIVFLGRESKKNMTHHTDSFNREIWFRGKLETVHKFTRQVPKRVGKTTDDARSGQKARTKANRQARVKS